MALFFNPFSAIHRKAEEKFFPRREDQNSKISLEKDNKPTTEDSPNVRQVLGKAKELTEEELLIITVGIKRQINNRRARKRARKYSRASGGRSSRGSGGIGDAIGDFFESIGDIFDAFN